MYFVFLIIRTSLFGRKFNTIDRNALFFPYASLKMKGV